MVDGRNPAPVENGGKHPMIDRLSTILNWSVDRWFIPKN